jgi:beta-barrel assembly-enhancing protease
MSKAELFIGREPANNIVYSDNTVSRRHAVLRCLDGDQFELEDLGSTNGTIVNGKLIESPVLVSFRDEIQFGSQKLNWAEVTQLGYGVSNSKQKKVNPGTVKLKIVFPYLLLIVVMGVMMGLFFWKGNVLDNVHKDNSMSSDTTSSQPSDSILESENREEETLSEKDRGDRQSSQTARFMQKNNPLVYSIRCLRSKSALNEVIGLGSDVEDGFIQFSADAVSLDDEIKVGREVKKNTENEYQFSTDQVMQQRISRIVNRLLNALENPRMTYRFYIIKSPEINAFTAGGLIFITTGIINFAKNDDELACIIGHEIYHNELGHINKLIRKEKAAKKWLGDLADWGLIASNIMGASFNQENEVYCDLYGADLAIKAGYDGRAARAFWSRMEKQNNAVDKMLSTHPFSDERMQCIEEHLERNYWLD